MVSALTSPSTVSKQAAQTLIERSLRRSLHFVDVYADDDCPCAFCSLRVPPRSNPPVSVRPRIVVSETTFSRVIKQATPRGCDRNISRQVLLHSASDPASEEVDDNTPVDDEEVEECPISGTSVRKPARTKDNGNSV